jgi:hypothetical protein
MKLEKGKKRGRNILIRMRKERKERNRRKVWRRRKTRERR